MKHHQQKLPWFPCYPEKLLNALAGMDADQGYLYTIVLLRIYENAGPVVENVDTLMIRSRMTRMRAAKALEKLIESGRIIASGKLLSNPIAEEVIAEQMAVNRTKKTHAQKAAQAMHKKRKENQQIEAAPAEHEPATKTQTEKEIKKESKSTASPRVPKKGSRIPDDWRLTPEMGNYGRSKGLHRREVEFEAEKFANYWRAKPGAAGVKLDWDATWRNWCISAAQRLGRTPPDVTPALAGAEIDRKTWENLSRIYASNNNWSRQWGPEPGERGCKMPADLQQQFVNPGLTAH